MSTRTHPLKRSTSPNNPGTGQTRGSGRPGGANSTGVGGLAEWWLKWWMDTTGQGAGVVAPVGGAVVAGLIDPAAIPLGLASGLLLGLLWSLGSGGKTAVVVGLVLFGPLTVMLLGAAADTAGGFLIAFLIGGLMPLVGIVAAVSYLRRPKPDEPHYRAHWAGRDEVSDLTGAKGSSEQGFSKGHGRGSGDSGELSDGVILGTHGDGQEPLVVRPGQDGRREMGHFLVCGPSRSGKSLNLTTNLMSWGGSAVAVDVKGELYRKTAGIRANLPDGENRILVLDPEGRGNQYDPFAELSYSEEAAKRAVKLILETDKARDPIFARRASSAVYAGLVGARIEGAPSLAYLREVTAEGPRAYVERLLELGDSGIRRNVVDFLGGPPEEMEPRDYRNDRFLSSAWGTITAQLDAVSSEGILKMTGGSDFAAADLVKGPATLYLMFSETELEYTEKIFQIIMLALTSGLIRHGDRDPEGASGESVPMLFALDEAGRTPIPRLSDMVSTIAGRGMAAMIYIQDLAQLEGAYGKEAAQTIRSNCHTQLYYRPQDHDTALHISKMAGQKSIEDLRKNTGGGGSESIGQRQRELITPDEVRQMSHEDIVVFTGNKPPILARRLEWFEFFDEAEALVDEYPSPEPEDLAPPEIAEPVSEVQHSSGEVDSGTDGGEEERPGSRDGVVASPASENGGNRSGVGRRGRRRERDHDDDAGGYVEPEL